MKKKESSNEILIELLTRMKIQTHFEKKDRVITIKLSELQDLLIKLLKLEGSVE
jgi:hypothetical protein